jgi:hydroxymethylbilane synthase
MMIPPMGQAALGIEIVKGKPKLDEIAVFLKDEATYIATQIERDFIAAIGAGCSAPVACNAVVDGDEVTFRVMLGFPDGTNVMHEKVIVPLSASKDIGKELAQKMIDNGAMQLLKDAEKIAFKDEMPQRI